MVQPNTFTRCTFRSLPINTTNWNPFLLHKFKVYEKEYIKHPVWVKFEYFGQDKVKITWTNETSKQPSGDRQLLLCKQNIPETNYQVVGIGFERIFDLTNTRDKRVFNSHFQTLTPFVPNHDQPFPDIILKTHNANLIEDNPQLIMPSIIQGSFLTQLSEFTSFNSEICNSHLALTQIKPNKELYLWGQSSHIKLSKSSSLSLFGQLENSNIAAKMDFAKTLNTIIY